MDNINVGQTISDLRKKRQLSLRALAQKIDLSPSILSQVERGVANPSLNTLRLIASGLEIPLYTLFVDDIDVESLILKKNNRKKIYRENDQHISYDLLSPDYMRSSVELLWTHLKPHSETTESYMQHNKEEFGIVMKGEVYVVIDNEEYFLEEGDTVRLLPRMKHKYKNKSNQVVEILYVLAESTL